MALPEMNRRSKFLVFAILITCALILATGTRGGLTYFSPDTLEYETQSEFTVFNGTLPIYRSHREPTDNALISYLGNSGLVAAQRPPTIRWMMVYHSNRAWNDGFGALYNVLVRDRQRIISWSQADPARARIYWTTGLQLLRSDVERERWAGEEILSSGYRCESIEELNSRISATRSEFGL